MYTDIKYWFIDKVYRILMWEHTPALIQMNFIDKAVAHGLFSAKDVE